MSLLFTFLTLYIINVSSSTPYFSSLEHHHKAFLSTMEAIFTNITRRHNKLRRRGLSAPNILTQSDKQSILDTHNKFRSMIALGQVSGHPSASDMNSMFYDLAVEKVATDYAQKLCSPWSGLNHNSLRSQELKDLQTSHPNLASFIYPDNPNGVYVGENLWWSSGSGLSNVEKLNGATEAWWNEQVNYDYSTDSSKGGVIGHYTQVVWQNSRYLGCGFYTDENCGSVFCCNYYPGGNYPRQPYTSGEPCSNCDKDRTTCENGLCSGCMNKAYHWDNTKTEPNLCNNGLGSTMNDGKFDLTNGLDDAGEIAFVVIISILSIIILLLIIFLLAKYGCLQKIQQNCCDKTFLGKKKDKNDKSLSYVIIKGLKNQTTISTNNGNNDKIKKKNNIKKNVKKDTKKQSLVEANKKKKNTKKLKPTKRNQEGELEGEGQL